MGLRVDRVLQLLEEYNLNQRELANKLGVTEVTVSRYINDEGRSPRIEIIAKMAEVFETSVEYLMGTTDIRDKVVIDYVDGFKKYMKDKGYNIDDMTYEEIADKMIKAIKLEQVYKSE